MSDNGVQGLPGTDPQQGQVSDFNSLVDEFLKEIPEADKNVVAPHVKTWDQKVSQRFQKIHDEYKPYKEFGTPEEIRQWKQVVDLVQNNPIEAYKNLEKYLKENNLLQEPTPPVGPGTQTPEQKPDLQGLPPEIVEKLNKIEGLETLVKQFGETFQNTQKAQETKEQAAQFDQWLNTMSEKYGDFDRDYATFRIANSDGKMSAEDIVKSMATPKPPSARTPPPLGAGAIPSASTDIKDMSRDDVKKLVMGMLTKET